MIDIQCGAYVAAMGFLIVYDKKILSLKIFPFFIPSNDETGKERKTESNAWEFQFKCSHFRDDTRVLLKPHQSIPKLWLNSTAVGAVLRET